MPRKPKSSTVSFAAETAAAFKGARPKGRGHREGLPPKSVDPRSERAADNDTFTVRFSDPKMRELLREGRSVKIVAHVDPGMQGSVQDVSAQPIIEDVRLAHMLVDALRRGEERIAAILAAPEMLTGEEMAQRLGISRVTVNTKRKSGELLGLIGNARGFRYPDWQLSEDGRPYPALREIAERLAGDVWTVYRFLVRPHDELDGVTGIEALRAGREQEVIEAAESVARAYG